MTLIRVIGEKEGSGGHRSFEFEMHHCFPECNSCKLRRLERDKAELEELLRGFRTFPMMGGPPIPWSVAELIYERYAARYGQSQTIETIAERGGFGWAEVEHIWKGKRR